MDPTVIATWHRLRRSAVCRKILYNVYTTSLVWQRWWISQSTWTHSHT